MRPWVTLALAGIAAPSARALPVSGGHTNEVYAAPAKELPIRGPRFSTVTIDLYLGLPLGPSQPDPTPLARRLADAGEVRLVSHLAGNGTPASILQGST